MPFFGELAAGIVKIGRLGLFGIADLLSACEASLRRLNTDYIDIYTLHGFDAATPIEEALRTLDD